MENIVADRIVSVQTITANTTPGVIELPISDDHKTYNSYGAGYNRDKVVYRISGSSTADVELVQTSSDTEGLLIKKDTQWTSPAWRLAGDPPIYLYAAGATDVRVTVLLVRETR